MKTNRFYLILLFLISLSSYSQTNYGKTYVESQMDNPTDPFHLIQERANAYFSSIEEAEENEEIEQLHEYYNRWQEYWNDHCTYPGVRAGGDIKGSQSLMRSLSVTTPYCTTSPAGVSPWVMEGPDPAPGQLCNVGIISAVAIDPANPNIIYAASNTAGLFKTTNGGTNWTHMTNNNIPGLGVVPGLGIFSIELGPGNTVLLGTNTDVFGLGYGIGIIKSVTGGTSWTLSSMVSQPSFGFTVRTIKYSAVSNVVLAGVGTKIYRSTDNGSTWAPSTTPSLDFDGIGSNPPQPTYYGCSGNSNVGAPFNMPARAEVIDIEQDNVLPNVMYASTTMYPHHGPSKLLMSSDNGQTWGFINLPTSTSWDAVSIDVTPADPGALYCFYYDKPSSTYCDFSGAKYTIAKTYNQGVTWTILDQQPASAFSGPWWAGGYGFWMHVFEVSNITPNDYLVAGTTIIKGTWGGSNYTYNGVTAYFPSLGVGNQHADIRDLKTITVGSSETVVSGCDGGVIQSTNSGNLNTWTCINGAGLNVSQFYGFSSFSKSTNIVASPQDNWVKIKSGSTWNVAPSGGAESYWAITDYTDDQIVYYNNYDYIMRSFNGGLSASNMGNPAGGVLGRRFYMDPTDHNKIWTGSAINPNLYMWNGSSWIIKHSPPPNVSNTRAVGIAPTNPNKIITSHFNVTYTGPQTEKMYLTNNGGASWTDISANIGAISWAEATDIKFDPFNENRIFVAFNGVWDNGSGGGANRVMYSGDGGITWSDMSNGLTPLGVNYLDYQNGSNDVIYAATEAGVYRWNKGSAIWECFNLGLPPSPVRKVEINYCNNRLLCSPYGRGMYSCPLPPIPDYHITSTNFPTGLTIPSTFNQTFNNRVFDDAGVLVKINGTMNFAGQGQYIVNKKAHTVLTGTLSTECPVLWNGLQVGGDVSTNQAYSGGFGVTQGIIEVLNGGTIRNAWDGISTFTTDALGNIDFSSFGGVVSCSKANFMNNWRDVQFMSYPFINKSAFVQCNFETSSLLLASAIPQGHVTMWNVKNVKFLGNDFKYTAAGAYPYGSHGFGIGSVDAKYTVSSWCLSGTIPCISAKRGTFTNLDVGIEANNSNPLQTVLVSECDFGGNYSDGARFSGVDYVTFVNNTLNVGAPSSLGSSGVYLNNSKFYSVQNNTISTLFTGQFTGVYTNQSGPGAHLIYRNNINNLLLGVAPQNDNSGNTNFTDGTKIKCNDFSNNIANGYDVAVLGWQPSVAYVQGVYVISTPSVLVGNKYNAVCSTQNRWYMDPSTLKGVVHSNHTDAFARVSPQPNCSDGTFVITNNAPTFYQASHCPNQYPASTTPPNPNINVSSAKVSLNSITNTYNSTIDGGSTQNLLTAINSNISAGELKSTLLNVGPYLSDQVMVAYVHSTPPPGIEKQILVANSPLTSNVMTEVNNAGLPSGTLNEIIEAQSLKNISDRKVLESQLADAKYNLEIAYADKIRYFLNDSLPGSNDSALVTIKLAGFEHGDCQILAAKVAEPGSTITATDIDNDHGGAANVDEFCSFQKIIIQLNQTAAKIYSLKTDPATKAMVEAIANDIDNEAVAAAQALLKQVFGIQYAMVRLVPPGGTSRFMSHSSEEEVENEIKLAENKILKFYPNPANSSVTVWLTTPSGIKGDYDVEIRNLLGEVLVKKTITTNKAENVNLADIPSAVYIISVKKDNKPINESKLVILR